MPEDDVIRDGWPSLRAIEVLDQFEQDYGNVVAALEWAATSSPYAGARLLFARRDLFLMLGQADGRRLADLLLERCPARDPPGIELLITAGVLAMLVADVPGAKRAPRAGVRARRRARRAAARGLGVLLPRSC